jgi:Ca2+-binding EF-hand superfamily protein
MDANQDGVLARDEMKAEVAKTMTGGDADKDGRLSTEENSTGVRTAFGGFAKQHAKEVDADGDGFITAAELEAIALRMFDKADANGDGKLAGEEVALPTGYQPAPPVRC